MNLGIGLLCGLGGFILGFGTCFRWLMGAQLEEEAGDPIILSFEDERQRRKERQA